MPKTQNHKKIREIFWLQIRAGKGAGGGGGKASNKLAAMKHMEIKEWRAIGGGTRTCDES